jgi:PAS domain S-box-containing protein
MGSNFEPLKVWLEIIVSAGGVVGVGMSARHALARWRKESERRAQFWDITDRLAGLPAVLEETNHRMGLMLDQVSKQQALMEFVARHTPAVIWLTDEKGIAYWFNEAWEELFGLSVADANDLGWQQAIHPDDREVTWRTWSDAVARGTKWSGNYRIIRGDKTIRCVATATPVRSGGVVIGYVGTTKPIERKGEATNERPPASASERRGTQD